MMRGQTSFVFVGLSALFVGLFGSLGCPEDEPDEILGFDNSVVVDGEELRPALASILAPPGGGEIITGKALVVVISMATDDDKDIAIDLPPLAPGTVDVAPFGAPGIQVSWDGVKYRARSGKAEIIEAGARADERVHIVFTDLVIVDDCGAQVLGLTEIVLTGEISETLDVGVELEVPVHGFIDTTFHLNVDVSFMGRLISEPGESLGTPGLILTSVDSCTFTNVLKIFLKPDLAPGPYPLRQFEDADVSLSIDTGEDPGFFGALTGTLIIEDVPPFEEGATLRGSLRDVTLLRVDGEQGFSVDDTDFVTVNSPL